MNSELLALLCCPKSGQRLFIDSNQLVSEDGSNRYIIENGIPRFVSSNNYADSFGMQWNIYPKTQLDSYSGHNISSRRFWKATGWNDVEMRDKWVLDVGCGSGRFAEVALLAGAKVVAVDYSSAVDACMNNFPNHPNLFVVQGDIYELPFHLKTFSFIYSLGVLQHTPDPEKAFKSLPQFLRKDGKICVDYYEKSYKSILLPKYWLRPITKKIPNKLLFKLLQKVTPFLLKCSILTSKIPFIGHHIKKIIPVVNYHGILPLNSQQHNEWSLLDTFDWFSPEHDHPQTTKTIKKWMEQANLSDIEIIKVGHLVARGKYKK